MILAFQNGFIAGSQRTLLVHLGAPGEHWIGSGHCVIDGKSGRYFVIPQVRSRQGLVKTAHPLCPPTDAFLVPKLNFLTKIFV